MDLAALFRNLTYCPSSGHLYWSVSKRGHRRAGDAAGHTAPNGYRFVKVEQVAYSAARVAWAMYYGREPAGEIDHINGDPSDNRIVNLREATRAQNCANVKGTGVRFEEKRGKWLARICVNYRQINLGRYATREEASAAYEAAKVKHRGEFARRA